MELKQLEYFMAVCRELHFTRAAETLNITQPSLSQQIKLLEHEIGTPLFDRMGKKTVITDAGNILLKHCHTIFHEISQAKIAINELQGLERGDLKIGALLTVVNYLLPPTVISFHKKYENIKLSIQGLRTGDIVQGLLQNELDLGIVMLPLEHDDFISVPLYREKLALAVPFHHPYSKKDKISLHELINQSFILLPRTYCLRQLIDQTCSDLGLEINRFLEMTTMESIVNMVIEGIGVTLLPRSYLEFINRSQLSIIPLVEPEITTEIGIVHRKNKFLCAASHAFMALLIETIHSQ
ncbi:MAG TPA: LysR substrate-binding domain-containing protein [Bacillota bacterium]|nr:LysR substrate-binding domain-containing protein [Bacillota bacterium]